MGRSASARVPGGAGERDEPNHRVAYPLAGTGERGWSHALWQDLDLSPYEARRAALASALLAREAARQPRVRAFRRRVVGSDDDVLSPEGAARLLASPAARFLAPERFRELGIPLADHEATLLRPPLREAWRFGGAADAQLEIRWGGRVVVETAWPPSGAGRSPVTVDLPGEAGMARRVEAWRGSVLGELAKAVDELVKRYPWRPDRSAWFALTGVPPLVDPLQVAVARGRGHDRARIVVSVEPWVSPDTVLRAYRAVQTELLGGEFRPLTERSLALVEFVTALEEDGRRPAWREVMERWNARYPAWAYADERRLSRDWRRIVATLYRPYRTDPSPAAAPSRRGGPDDGRGHG